MGKNNACLVVVAIEFNVKYHPVGMGVEQEEGRGGRFMFAQNIYKFLLLYCYLYQTFWRRF